MVALNTRVRDSSHFLFPRLTSLTPGRVQSSIPNVEPITPVWTPQRAARLAWGIYDAAQTAGRERDLFLPLAIECCKVVHHVILIPGVWGPHTTAGSLPSSLADNMEELLLVLEGIRDQLDGLRIGQGIARHRVEQSRHDVNRLDQIFNEQSSTIDARDTGRHVVPRSRTSSATSLPIGANVASTIYLVLLLDIPSLYASRIQNILSGTECKSNSLKMQYLTASPETQSEPPSLEPWDTFTRTLVKEWMTLRILSGLILGTIFSMFQISGLWGNQLMMVAALISFAALVYGAVLTIYVNGWRDDSGLPMWVKGVREPFRIGFLWSPWILLGLPAIWTTWGVILFFLSVMMIWISAQGDDSGPEDLVPFASDPARLTIPPRSAVAHPWFIPLFAIALLYLTLMIYTLRGLGRRHQRSDGHSPAV